MFKPLILIVDDEKDFADTLANKIKETGKYDVKAVYSARDAFLEVEKNKWFLDIPKNRIRCVLLDIKMPEMDGMEFINRLWKIREEYEHTGIVEDAVKTYIPVIILSAWEDQEKWENTPRKLGYLRKPVKDKELFVALEKVIKGGPPEWRQMQRETQKKGTEKGFLK